MPSSHGFADCKALGPLKTTNSRVQKGRSPLKIYRRVNNYDDMEHLPLVIVGAGLAGLRVADGLADKGVTNITVLERYPNVGGRVVTHRENNLQYEIGAGRIHTSHTRVLSLARRFRLHTFPIGEDVEWVARKTPATPEPDGFSVVLDGIRMMLQTASPRTLATHTLAELLPPAWAPLLKRFPYWAELYLQRADAALEAFKPDAPLAAYGHFVGLREGLDALTTHLANAVRRKGVALRTRYRIQDVRRAPEGGFDIVGDFGKKAEARPFHIRARRVILATCRCSMSIFSVLARTPMLRQLQTSPLLRIYAVYPPNPRTGRVWFDGLAKTVTDSPLRYVIPIDPAKGLIMISYTDGPTDTEYWRKMASDAQLLRGIQREVRHLFETRFGPIPDPVYLKRHDWPSGCTYWVPGRYDIGEAIEKAMHPEKGLWVVGESVSRQQAWMEGALESAERLLGQWRSRS